VSGLLRSAGSQVPLRVVDEQLFSQIAGTEAPQGVIALVQPPDWAADDLFRAPALLVVLDAVQDPGNAGTIVRAAEAFGGSGVLFLEGTVSPFNSKTLRASAGSLFRLPYLTSVGRDLALKELRRRSVQTLAACSHEGSPPEAFDWTLPTALIVGSEAHGVSEGLSSAAAKVRIPTRGVESLNAAVAAAVLLYGASRQRAGGRSHEPV
jgi:TrmH family RNA methyltransferase